MALAAHSQVSAPDATNGHAPADVLVIFGITGDLAKVMTFRSLYRLEQRGLLSCPLVGVAVDDGDVGDLRRRARTSIESAGERVEEPVFERLAERMSYVCAGACSPSASSGSRRCSRRSSWAASSAPSRRAGCRPATRPATP